MNRKGLLSALPILIGLLLVVNLLVGGGSTAMVDDARSKCVKDGLPAENMNLIRYECDEGRFGFGGRGLVEFGPEGTDPLEILRVELSKRMNLLGWQADSVIWHVL